jgi:hypothetical protein
MRILKSLLSSFGFIIVYGKNCWKISKNGGPIIVVHPSKRAFYPTRRLILSKYKIDINPKKNISRKKANNNTRIGLVSSQRPSKGGEYQSLSFRHSSNGRWDQEWEKLHSWEKKYLREISKQINNVFEGIEIEKIIPHIPKWGNPYLSKGGISAGREYKKRYGAEKMFEICEYIIRQIHNSSNKGGE